MRKSVWTTTNLQWHPQHGPLLLLVLILTLGWVCLGWLFSAPELYAVDVSHLINLSVFVARRYAPRYFCAWWNVVQSPSVFVGLDQMTCSSVEQLKEGKKVWFNFSFSCGIWHMYHAICMHTLTLVLFMLVFLPTKVTGWRAALFWVSQSLRVIETMCTNGLTPRVTERWKPWFWTRSHGNSWVNFSRKWRKCSQLFMQC